MPYLKDDDTLSSSINTPTTPKIYENGHSLNKSSKQARNGRLSLNFLRSRSMSRNREIKVFPNNPDPKFIPVNAFEKKPDRNLMANDTKVVLRIKNANECIITPEKHIPQVDRSRFSYSVFDELLESGTEDDILLV